MSRPSEWVETPTLWASLSDEVICGKEPGVRQEPECERWGLFLGLVEGARPEASVAPEVLQMWGFSVTHSGVLAVLARKCFLLLDS